MTVAQRNAYRRAVAANLSARVLDCGKGRYMVPSQSSRDVYALWAGSDGALHCPCVAGEHDRFCTHKAAVALYVTQVTALEQARQMAPIVLNLPEDDRPLPKAPRFPARKEVKLL